jgi:hypothetical protein
LHDAFDAGIPIVARKGSDNALTGAKHVFLDRDRAKSLRCVWKRSARVCVNKQLPAFKGQSDEQLRATLNGWSKRAYLEVSTKGGFAAALHHPARQRSTRA